MENKKEDPSYYAIIPANVRYDERLTANAKLLYGEITALCNDKGYCWATNEYFANLYKVSKVSISGWIKNLADCGYIHIQLDNSNKENLKRYLSILNGGIKENFNTGIKENLMYNNTRVNNTVNNTKNKKTSSGLSFDDVINNYTENENLRTALAEFIQKRKKMNKPIEPSGLQRLLTKQNSGLFTISNGNDNLAVEIVHESIDNCWRGFFPLKTQKVEKRQESIAERIARL